MSGNFKNLFHFDMRSNKASLQVSSKDKKEDNSFNKLSAVKRLDSQFNNFALMDEEKFYIYDLRNCKNPVSSVEHFLHETVEFTEIISPISFGSL